MNSADIQLLEKIKRGESKAFEYLFEKNYKPMVAKAYSKLKDLSTSEDLVQEIFAELWHNRKHLDVTSNLSGYLMTAVKYKVFRHIDRQRLICQLLPEHDSKHFINGDILAFEELYGQLQVMIEKLPQKEKEVFVLSRFQYLNIAEIAGKLHLAPQTVHNRMHQALKFLRAELRHYLLNVFIIVFSVVI
ncbi:RNA polymerase sigma factor [Pleomorphovibrio marinus]|uniref:RNA polymerase sigma factor n=1 Tax=Pleomorphovibrio marinus TaxID=2164132 RepID=UPI000E0B527E|nr:sigma-70 family RNA polymerase sigma factor [Pleomorphovibrio marinus]